MRSKRERITEASNRKNIVVIQCLFRNFLTSKQVNFQSAVLTPRMRKGLDFEMYYLVDDDMLRTLLNTTFLVSNCKRVSEKIDKPQIAELLKSMTPLHAFLTNANSDPITEKDLSPQQTAILKKLNAQKDGMKIYRFNFFYNSYSAMYSSLTCKDGKALDNGTFTTLLKNGKRTGIRMEDTDRTTYPISELQIINPFVTSGYWTEITYDPKWDSFSTGDTIAEPFIPSLAGKLKAQGLYPSNFFREFVSGPDDIDMSLLEQMTTAAVSIANEQGNDFRNKAVNSMARSDDNHMLRSFRMLSRESKEVKHSKKQIEEAIARWTKKLNQMTESEVRDIQISFDDGMWKAQDLKSGGILFGAGKFFTVFEKAQEDFPRAKIYANVDGQTTIIRYPKS